MNRATHERLIDEHLELLGKMKKLSAFLTSDKFDFIDTQNQDLLIEQLSAMERYAEILEDRIAIN